MGIYYWQRADRPSNSFYALSWDDAMAKMQQHILRVDFHDCPPWQKRIDVWGRLGENCTIYHPDHQDAPLDQDRYMELIDDAI